MVQQYLRSRPKLRCRHERHHAACLVTVAHGMSECAAAANVAVKPAPSGHRFTATGLTATRSRESDIDTVKAAFSPPIVKRVATMPARLLSRPARR